MRWAARAATLAYAVLARRLPERLRAVVACQSGAAILEFALLLPVLVALAFGTVEVARGVATYAAVERATRSGARYLARVADPTCDPACSWGAARAIDLARREILAETRLSSRAIRVMPRRDPPPGTVVLETEVGLALPLLSNLGLPAIWTIRVARQERYIAG